MRTILIISFLNSTNCRKWGDQLMDLHQNKNPGSNPGFPIKILLFYFFMYITSFTSFTVRGTSGSAAATRFGA